MKNCQCDTTSSNEGSSQLQRYLKALDPSYAPIDGRNLDDMLLFAKKYAAQIRFYDIPEAEIIDQKEEGKISWLEFFRRDMSVIAASISTTDADFFLKEFTQVRERLQWQADADVFGALFAPVLGMLRKIDHWYTLAIPENPLHSDLLLAIHSNLRSQVQRIIAYKNEFHVVDPHAELRIEFSDIENGKLWGLDWPYEPVDGLYEGIGKENKIRYAALFVEEIFHAFYGFLRQLVNESVKYMQFAMEQYPAHQPFMALFISFLDLFAKLREQMNGLTGKMLDFYYREVLQLTERKSLPDKAYVVFELAREIAEYNIANGTLLKGGKDSSGKELFYKTNAEQVINQAKVKQLSTVYIKKSGESSSLTSTDSRIQNIYARPFANSRNGFGEKFLTPHAKWPTFGYFPSSQKNKQTVCSRLNDLSENIILDTAQARIGFAFASAQLLLQGGKRLIRIGLNVVDGKPTDPDKLLEKIAQSLKGIDIWLSGKNGWIKIGAQQNVLTDEQKKFIEYFRKTGSAIFPVNPDPGAFYFIDEEQFLNIYLPVATDAVVGFDSHLHKGFSFETKLPMVMILNRDTDELNILESAFSQARGRDIVIHTKVGSIVPPDYESLPKGFLTGFQFDGLKKLVLQNESGVIPEGQVIAPFTTLPEPGKPFYVGSDEAFNKPLNSLAVFIKKNTDLGSEKAAMAKNALFIPGHGKANDFQVSILDKRSWLGLCDKLGRDFTRISIAENILQYPKLNEDGKLEEVIPFQTTRHPIGLVNKWTGETEKGFIRIENLQPVPAGDNHTQQSQNQAHELEIKEISLSYESKLLFEKNADQLFHIYPFGVTEINVVPAILKKKLAKELTPIEKDERILLKVRSENKLLPQFSSGMLQGQAKQSIESKLDSLSSAAERIYIKTSSQNNQYTGNIQEEGMLFIGLEKLNPLQSVSLLFQFAEGSAEDEDEEAPTIHWSYLSYNDWRSMPDEGIISDGTYGFQATGIVRIDIPADATLRHTIMPDDLIWICASVTEHANRIPMLIDVFTQAVETHFDDHQNAASHFDKALAAGNINKLLNPVPQVSRVSQPFASFDGKHAEIGKEFYTRVSERLRHKQRAITGWDYERIILDRFPSIYKIKCIGHTDPACLCRDFEKPMAADTSLDEVIETASIKYKDEFETDIKNENSDIIKKILKKIASDNELVYIIGHYDSADGTVNSRELNEKRLAELENWLVNKFSVDAALIRKSILPDGIENRVDLEQRKPKKIKETIIGKVCCGPQVSPGHVLLIPIADLKNRNALNPLQPKTSRKTLLDIEAYCKKMTSPFVKVHAKNPVYEEILVSCKVKFHRGTEKGFYLKKLNEDIKQFLTPWAFDETAEIVFGQKIYASSIINFIEGLPYVDFITDFLMFLCENPCCPDIDVDPIKSSAVTLDTVNSCCDLDEFISTKGFPGNTVAKASGPRTILVSAARHDISLYEERPTLSPCQKVNLANTLPPKRGIEEKKSVAELLTKEKAGERKSNVVNPAGNTIAAKKKQKK